MQFLVTEISGSKEERDSDRSVCVGLALTRDLADLAEARLNGGGSVRDAESASFYYYYFDVRIS